MTDYRLRCLDAAWRAGRGRSALRQADTHGRPSRETQATATASRRVCTDRRKESACRVRMGTGANRTTADGETPRITPGKGPRSGAQCPIYHSATQSTNEPIFWYRAVACLSHRTATGTRAGTGTGSGAGTWKRKHRGPQGDGKDSEGGPRRRPTPRTLVTRARKRTRPSHIHAGAQEIRHKSHRPPMQTTCSKGGAAAGAKGALSPRHGR